MHPGQARIRNSNCGDGFSTARRGCVWLFRTWTHGSPERRDDDDDDDEDDEDDDDDDAGDDDDTSCVRLVHASYFPLTCFSFGC